MASIVTIRSLQAVPSKDIHSDFYLSVPLKRVRKFCYLTVFVCGEGRDDPKLLGVFDCKTRKLCGIGCEGFCTRRYSSRGKVRQNHFSTYDHL